MENTIIIIILIIVFNLIRRLLGAGLQQKTAGRTARVRSSRPKVDLPFEYTGETSYDLYDSRENEAFSRQQQEIKGPERFLSPAGKELPGTGDGAERAATPAAVKTGPVVRNLQRVLEDKNSLVAAFIFHEVLDSPSSRRKKHSVYSRIK